MGFRYLFAVAILAGALTLHLLAPPADAQESSSSPKSAPTTTVALDKERSGVLQQRNEIKKRLEELETLGVTTEEISLLRTLEHLLDQRMGTLEERANLLESQEKLRRELTAPVGADAYSADFTQFEKLRDEFDAVQNRISENRASRKLAQQNLTDAEKEQDLAERNHRSVAEKARIATDPTIRLEFEAEGHLSSLRAQAGRALTDLRRDELTNEGLRGEVLEKQQQQLARLIAAAERRVVFSRRELRQQLEELTRLEAITSQTLESVQGDVATADRLLSDAKTRLESEVDPSPPLIEEVAARQLAKQLRDREVSLLREELARYELRRTVWNQRFQLLGNASDESQFSTWRKDAEAKLEELARVEQQYESKRKELEAELKRREEQIRNETSTSVARWYRDQRGSLNRAINAFDAVLKDVAATKSLLQRFSADLERRSSRFSVVHLADTLWKSVRDVWEFEITSVDDRPITVRKVFIAAILFILGFVASRRLSRALSNKLLPRFHLPLGATAAIESLVFYVLLASFVFLALRIVHIPLTVFTLLGGALAIGVGFGSQNIISNFISGVILLIEQPIRVGDVIEIDQMKGSVSHIGTRSTRLRTGQNTDIIVPNSAFLEKHVINWTLSDGRVRATVAIGVSYSSDPKNVKELLLQAAEEHPNVLKIPTPFVWLVRFGDSSLDFELHFWVDMSANVDRAAVESDVRFRVLELFRQQGVEIPFPRRDVSISLRGPLDVRHVVDANNE